MGGTGLKPKVIQLSEDSILASEPSIAECLPVSLRGDRSFFFSKCPAKIGDGAIERFRRIVLEFGNGVHAEGKKRNGRPRGPPIGILLQGFWDGRTTPWRLAPACTAPQIRRRR